MNPKYQKVLSDIEKAEKKKSEIASAQELIEYMEDVAKPPSIATGEMA